MIKRRRFPKIFFGWWTVLSSAVLMFWSGGFQVYGFSVFFKPIAAELGLSRAVASTAVSIGRLEGGFEGPVAGWAADKFGPRAVALLGVFLWGLGMVLVNYINSLWAFLVVWGVILGTAQNVTTGVPPDTAISNWFVKKRGIALGTKWVISGAFSGILVTLVAWLIINLGWRMTAVIGGVGMWLVGLPLVWFCLRPHRPEYYGLLPDGAKVTEEAADTSHMIDKGAKYAAEVQEVEFTLRQAMRTPAFWVLIAANAVHSMAMPVINIHGVPFLTDRGIDPLRAAGILAMMLWASIPFRLVGGLLADRVSRHHLRFIIAGAYFIQALGFAVFLLNQTTAMIYVWFILYGIGQGAATTPLPAMRARYFGRKAFGSIQGTSTLFMTPVGVIAPIYAGWIYDTTGSYISAFTLITGLIAIATVLACFILPPKPPAQVTDIRKLL